MAAVFIAESYIKEKIMSKVIKGMILTAVAVAGLVAPSVVYASYNQADYTGNGKPQFNVYTDVPGLGNEKDFLRVGPAGSKLIDAVNEQTACEGEVQLFVYVHNGAPEGFNGEDNDGTGVAKDTKVQVSLPETKGKKQKISAVISASNADSVTDTAFISCDDEDIKVEYVKDSATNVTLKNPTLHAVSNDIVTDKGALIGTYKNDGVVPGCWEFRNYVSLKVKVTKVKKPVTPEKPEKPEKPVQPEAPKEMPVTGPGSVAAAFVATSAAGAVAHSVVTRRARR